MRNKYLVTKSKCNDSSSFLISSHRGQVKNLSAIMYSGEGEPGNYNKANSKPKNILT